MNNIFHRIWHIIRIPFWIILALYIGVVIYRIPAAQERLKTEKVVKEIQSQKLTLADVLGKNLPPEPDPKLKDATVEGVDANNNGIRDDVELAIFKLHPDSARIRAAELQYAKVLQAELTQVFNSNTLVATMQEEGRANLCIKDTVPPRTASDSPSVVASNIALMSARVNEAENLVVNTEIRKLEQKEIYRKYMTSYGSIEKENCDIDLASLPN